MAKCPLKALSLLTVIYIGSLTSVLILPKQTKRPKETVEESGVLEKQMKQNTSKALKQTKKHKQSLNTSHQSLVIIVSN